MPVTVDSSGTQSATVTTEHSLYSTSSAKILQAVVDLANMVNDDELEIRVKVKAISGGTARLAFYGTYKHDQGDVLAVTPPIASPYYWELTLKQTAGTSRNYDWYVVSV